MLNRGSVSYITNCNFTQNSASEDGGAMFWYPEVMSIYISGCKFQGNT
eukprot:SAG31_NODE_37443_length_304_cov_0.760976_1_plen_47_part_01